MYTPKPFADTDAAGLALIERSGFGLLVMSLDGRPELSHLPFVLDRAGGRLLAHVARANPIWRAIDGAAEAVAVFQGPNAYISPDWYEKPKAAVPTWNYAAAHVHGTPVLLDDEGLIDVLVRLSAVHEAKLLPKRPWTVDKLDEAFFAGLRKAIVGFALPIARIETKVKMSQNKTASDQAGLSAALRAVADPDAQATAELMEAIQAAEAADADGASAPR